MNRPDGTWGVSVMSVGAARAGASALHVATATDARDEATQLVNCRKPMRMPTVDHSTDPDDEGIEESSTENSDDDDDYATSEDDEDDDED